MIQLTVCSKQSGYSLVETTVAIALLTTVLVPIGHFMLAIVAQKSGWLQAQQIAIAQQTMERALSVEFFSSETNTMRMERWIVETNYEIIDSGTRIVVRVADLKGKKTSLTLTAYRPLITEQIE